MSDKSQSHEHDHDHGDGGHRHDHHGHDHGAHGHGHGGGGGHAQPQTSPRDPTAMAAKIFHALNKALAEDPKAKEPLNALILWTELGKGLAGTLEKVGADRGLLRELVLGWCAERASGKKVDLARWAYRLEEKERLGKVEASMAMRQVQAALEEALPEMVVAAANAESEDRKHLFLIITRGWFPMGLEILKAFPAGRGADDATLAAAIGAWCEKYLPATGATPAELGIRVTREG